MTSELNFVDYWGQVECCGCVSTKILAAWKGCNPFLYFCCLCKSLVVAQPENANNVENQPVEDPPSSRFTWRIDNFSRMNTKKLYSDIFVVGGYKWYCHHFFLFDIAALLWYICSSLASFDRSLFALAGVCLFFPRETMWIICRCIWMLRIHQICHMGGVDMHSLAWELSIKFITSILYAKVPPWICFVLIIHCVSNLILLNRIVISSLKL